MRAGGRRAQVQAARSRARQRPRRMRGVAAIEFMIVMILLLPAFYAAIAFSLSLVARQMLSQAAAEGARAALRSGTLAQRQGYATTVINQTLTWPALAQANGIVFSADPTYPCPTATPTIPQCILHVTLTSNQGLVASWPGLGTIVPQTLTGTAAVTLDTSTLTAGT
ncbi:TadE family protein [Pandoraea terrae]|uniref:TadE family protein n=1 Tax=Pandoraea terrae TaxID=1537710 RepID=A0A5E4Z6X7_9BURK|nr:TadE family protein [Pandoraea terrae]VVE56518.1 TadE family protein [Pandoraea terrae]